MMLHNQKVQDNSIKCESRQSQEPSERKSCRENDGTALDFDVFFEHLELVNFPGFRRLFKYFAYFCASYFQIVFAAIFVQQRFNCLKWLNLYLVDLFCWRKNEVN